MAEKRVLGKVNKNKERKKLKMNEIYFINNTGGGFAKSVQVASGTSLQSFLTDYFHRNVDGREFVASEWMITVNRESAEAGYVLEDGDRVSMTPCNVKGNNR